MYCNDQYMVAHPFARSAIDADGKKMLKTNVCRQPLIEVPNHLVGFQLNFPTVDAEVMDMCDVLGLCKIEASRDTRLC